MSGTMPLIRHSAPTRRSFLIGLGAGSLATAGLSRRAAAAGATDVLKVGFISPRTGALAGFGHTDDHILDVARKALAAGLKIGEKTYQVELLDRDSQSDPSRASQLAKSLIGNDKIDLMLAVSTPEVINPVADVCEAAAIPCLSTVMPWEAWYFGRGAKPGQPSPFKWTYHFGFGMEQFFHAYASQWSLIATNKRVGVLYPNDADGNAFRGNLIPLLTKQGFTVIDAGPYENGVADYSAQIALFKKEQCEIFNTAPLPPDFTSFWRQAAQQGFTRKVKICQSSKTGLFPDSIEVLGKLGYNVSSAAYWHKAFPYTSPVTGLSSAELADGYEAASGKQWTQQLGASLALIDAGVAALRASATPTDKTAVAAALAGLNTMTVAGKVDFTSGPVPNVAATPVVGTQWVRAPEGSKFKLDYVVTENAGDPNVPIGGPLRDYNS